MNLRRTHEYSEIFDAILIVIAVGLVWAAYVFLRRDQIFLASLFLIADILLLYGSLIEPHRLTVKRYRVSLVPESKTVIRIVLLSDLHAGGFHSSRWYERIVLETQALRPDLLLLGGDYVVDRSNPIEDLKSLQGLQAPLGKFFVLGNHDFMDRPHEIREAFERYGFQDLTGQSVLCEREDRKFELQGVDDHWHGNPQLFRRQSPEIPHVTLSHEPDVLLDLKVGDTDLVLSGHTHGGQIFLPLIGPLYIPSKLGRAVDRREKIVNGIRCIISNGLGETDSRVRLFSPPQIVVVEVGI